MVPEVFAKNPASRIGASLAVVAQARYGPTSTRLSRPNPCCTSRVVVLMGSNPCFCFHCAFFPHHPVLGGGGGFLQAEVKVSPGELLEITVGGGGYASHGEAGGGGGFNGGQAGRKCLVVDATCL